MTTGPGWRIGCRERGHPYPEDGLPHRCPACASPWAVTATQGAEAPPTGRSSGLRRHATRLGVGPNELPARLLASPARRLAGAWVSQQGSAPVGSFKERGAELLVAVARRRGLRELFTDSSGNAGLALARACAARGLRCRILVPRGTPAAMLEAIRRWGARVDRVPGDRAAAARAAAELARDLPWASHVHQPHFRLGVATLAWELFEELGHRLPERVYLPVGNGSLLLGFQLGCEVLAREGGLAAVPRPHAVQLAGFATLTPAGPGGPRPPRPRAVGIAIAAPPRLAEMRAGLERAHGDVVVVTGRQIARARRRLATAGFFVDATGAAAWAGYRSLRPAGEEPLVVLTSRKEAEA